MLFMYRDTTAANHTEIVNEDDDEDVQTGRKVMIAR